MAAAVSLCAPGSPRTPLPSYLTGAARGKLVRVCSGMACMLHTKASMEQIAMASTAFFSRSTPCSLDGLGGVLAGGRVEGGSVHIEVALRRGSSASAPARRFHQGVSCCSFSIDGSGTARAPVPGTEAAAESACTLRLNSKPSAPTNCSRVSSPSAGCRPYPTARHHRSSNMTHRV
jgi:hypothetical protein